MARWTIGSGRVPGCLGRHLRARRQLPSCSASITPVFNFVITTPRHLSSLAQLSPPSILATMERQHTISRSGRQLPRRRDREDSTRYAVRQVEQFLNGLLKPWVGWDRDTPQTHAEMHGLHTSLTLRHVPQEVRANIAPHSILQKFAEEYAADLCSMRSQIHTFVFPHCLPWPSHWG